MFNVTDGVVSPFVGNSSSSGVIDSNSTSEAMFKPTNVAIRSLMSRSLDHGQWFASNLVARLPKTMG